MIRLATIRLEAPNSTGTARAFLPTSQIHRYTIPELEGMLAACFADESDRRRIDRIKELAVTHGQLRFSVHPGETAPPEYHVYVTNPDEPEVRIFACVLAPEPVLIQMLEEESGPLFETATFQGIDTDTSTAGIQAALTNWMRRLWPETEQPQSVVRPWPIEEVHSNLPPAPQVDAASIPKGALTLLPDKDFPTPEELAG